MDIFNLQKEIDAVAAGNGIEVIGTTAGDLAGVDLSDPSSAYLQRSPCALLKWVNQNNPWGYSYKTFYELSFNGGVQGVIIEDEEGDFVARAETTMYGGSDGDPKKVIYENNKAIVNILLRSTMKTNHWKTLR